MARRIVHDHHGDGIDRRGFLECMAWVGTGIAWTVTGGILSSRVFGQDSGQTKKGDFMFVQSVGRPDLGGQGAAWGKLLWRSLERVRRSWPGELLVLPAHYASERERRADRGVAARFDVIAATNEAVAIQDEQVFLAWVTGQTVTAPEAYRTIKLANLGLMSLSEADAEIVEFGPNQCAVPGAA